MIVVIDMNQKMKIMEVIMNQNRSLYIVMIIKGILKRGRAISRILLLVMKIMINNFNMYINMEKIKKNMEKFINNEFIFKNYIYLYI